MKDKSLQELKALKAEYEQQKAALLDKKASSKSWPEASQDLLDNTVGFIADIEDAIDEAKEKNDEYVVPKGTEKSVHLLMHHGNSYHPMTGQLISEKRVQILSYSEWAFFKKSYKLLGYTIDKVLHDPYNEASKYVN